MCGDTAKSRVDDHLICIDASIVKFAFQRLQYNEKMSSQERVCAMETLLMLRLRGLQMHRTDSFDISELKFTASAYDLAHNLIGIVKARRAQKLGEVGFPDHRNNTRIPVSNLDGTQFILNDG